MKTNKRLEAGRKERPDRSFVRFIQTPTAVIERASHIFLDRAHAHTEPIGDLAVSQPLEAVEHEDPAAQRRQFLQGVKRHSQFFLCRDRHLWRGGSIQMLEQIAFLLNRMQTPAYAGSMMIDREIRRDAEQVGPEVSDRLKIRQLGQPQKGFLCQIGSRSLARDTARQKAPQVWGMVVEERSEVHGSLR